MSNAAVPVSVPGFYTLSIYLNGNGAKTPIVYFNGKDVLANTVLQNPISDNSQIKWYLDWLDSESNTWVMMNEKTFADVLCYDNDIVAMTQGLPASCTNFDLELRLISEPPDTLGPGSFYNIYTPDGLSLGLPETLPGSQADSSDSPLVLKDSSPPDIFAFQSVLYSPPGPDNCFPHC